jgi:predicted pyridoxine 5'-phosphate oxidase superfamily flavin-nucleotide-binding protein
MLGAQDQQGKEEEVSELIVFITTFQIENGALEKFKEASRKSTDFLEANGPQLMAEVCIDENEMRAHGVQVHRDSESILSHWQLSDPYMRDVMQYITTTRVDIYGEPNEDVIEGMRRLSSKGAVLTVTPRFVGFSRFPGIG